MSTTTIAAIRDRATTVLRALTPNMYSSDPFVPFEEEDRAQIEPWANENADGATRVFQVRQVGEEDDPTYSDTTTEELFVRIRITVCYPASNRWGLEEALARDNVIASDGDQIRKAVGLYGKPNFTPPFPDACWRPSPKPLHTTLRGGACDFLIIEQTMSYFRAT